MTQPSRLHIFQAYGVELEYMIVDKNSLDIRPIADDLLKKVLGHNGDDFENGLVTWSNELVLHVIELKSTKPESNFNVLENAFADNVALINKILASWDAVLLPTAAHPWMDPQTETRLWPHGSNEIYDIYNKIFDCRGHGWSNLQSTHLNLPFYDDEEFARLHAAIRLILPILPAICASSPILDGRATGSLDTRMGYYKTNQIRIPSITGKVVPEAVFSRRMYQNLVYDKIKSDVAPFDPENLLNPIWVNSRGAIPRFDRGSIEIRIMDIQECPRADLAIQTLVIETIHALVQEKFAGLEEQFHAKTEILAGILDETSRYGQSADILSPEYAGIFGLQAPCTAGQLWEHLLAGLLENADAPLENWKSIISTILRDGTLSDRILASTKNDDSLQIIKDTYRKLSGCLAQNKMFVV